MSMLSTDNFCNFCFYLQNRLCQTSQAGGQWYNDTSPFSIPCCRPNVFWRKVEAPIILSDQSDPLHFPNPFFIRRGKKSWLGNRLERFGFGRVWTVINETVRFGYWKWYQFFCEKGNFWMDIIKWVSWYKSSLLLRIQIEYTNKY